METKPTYENLHIAADWWFERGCDKKATAPKKGWREGVELMNAALALQTMAVQEVEQNGISSSDYTDVIGTAARMAYKLRKTEKAAIFACMIYSNSTERQMFYSIKEILKNISKSDIIAAIHYLNDKKNNK